MIDLRLLRENPDVVRASQRARGDDEGQVAQALSADDARRAALSEFETMRAEQKRLSKQVGAAKGDEKQAVLAEVKELSERVKKASAAADEASAAAQAALRKIANVVHPDVPHGGEDQSVVLRTHGEKTVFSDGFEPLDHLAVAERIGGIDSERGAKVSGSRFHFLHGQVARLERALFNYALDQAVEWGLELMLPPTLVRPDVMEGTGFLGEHAAEVYRLEADGLYLVGTSEVPLVGYLADEIIDLSDGPKRFVAVSTCYRREAGSHGKDTRGIIRVHQFNKAEMVSLVPVEQAEEEHAQMLTWEEHLLQAVEVPYHVLDVAAGDLGSSAARKYDCEAWIPTQGRYRELTSTSNCTTFQARRLNIRERAENGTRPVATLNGTLVTDRWLVAILENHQRPDGSVHVPEALRSYLGGLKELAPLT